MTTEATILMCVGATKAGTTWLFRHLSAHPDCHLRTIKELHYFDTVEVGGYDRQIALKVAEFDAVEAKGPGDRPWMHKRKLRDLADWAAVLEHRAEDAAAYLGYLMQGRGDRRVVGDVTPAYALLPVERLRRIAGLSGDVRFVYLIRDPLARLWSHVRMLAARAARGLGDLAAKAHGLMDRALSGDLPAATERGDYAGALARLDAAVAPSRLLVMFYEDLMSRSGGERLHGFLGIGATEPNFDRRVHEGVALELEAGHRARALAYLRPQYDFVARRFPALPENWRRNMGEVHG